MSRVGDRAEAGFSQQRVRLPPCQAAKAPTHRESAAQTQLILPSAATT
ncbi:hypothetical protein I545_0796 [Mycobacterium kansasii 662]|uniref:Uncharacterized protein n=2 Tax=Mycobacterium kansasii TaxID=1768 RepID=A0A1V3XV61_MYCKA|nr:hypothetical protein I547_0519 [Mycobacterium kansasii 824]EUA21628.1 hypothetical protein I545_0796 [Mycobacterium kansasii 662]OOK82982.1 hypothetical protein BZL30_0959 [Mycobacterium kansasii]